MFIGKHGQPLAGAGTALPIPLDFFSVTPSLNSVNYRMPTDSEPAQNGDLRRRILDTARHLLVQEGYQNLSMRKIAREIDYSATSIYLYFDNKDALLHALIHEGMMKLRDRLQDTARMHDHDPVHRLEALCGTFIEFGLENPEYYEIMFQLRPERMERYPAEKYRQARENLEFFATALSQGVDAGVFQVDDPHVSTSTIWASLHGTVSLLLAERVDVRIDRDAFIQTTVQQTIRSCMPVGETTSSP
jgi:AcrR family transcriptional regulator